MILKYGLIMGAFLSVLAVQSAAAPIGVRSGAHEGFSRLVLDVPPGTDWAVENQDGLARVTVAGHADGFDISNVFDRIDRSRVADVTASTSSIDIQFACECRVTAFEQGARMIVLDVSEASAAVQKDEQIETPSDPSRPVSGIAEANPIALPRDAHTQRTGVAYAANSNIANAARQLDQTPLADNGRLQQARAQITSEFSIAASRGLLSPKTRTIDLPLTQARPQIDTRIFDSSAQQVMPADTVTPMEGSNLRITSSADIAINERGSSVATSLGISCADPKTMNVNDWGSDQPFSSQISGYRNLLFSEFDRLNTDAAVKLARAYLYFGFGAEARQILSMDAQLARDYPALIEIAEIMEYGSANNARYLPNFTECDTTVALWAILAEPSIDTAKQINIKAALRTVTALPMHLRRFIAPELSRRLLDYGDPDAAAAALRSVERTAEPMSPNANLARANLDLAQGKVAEGQERLAKVVSSNVEQSAAALIQFIDSHLDADAEIDQSVATLVEGYALQMRDEPIGAELRRAHVLALGKSGQFDAAFDALDRVRERDAASMDLTLKSSILTLLTQNGEDIEFLDHVFEQMTYSLGSVKPRAKVKIARRLVDLGFAREAETVLGAREDIPNTAAIKILRGQIALELGRPFEAEALAYGIDTPEADMLRARAKWQAGAYEAAHSILEDLGEQDASEHSAWLANSWTALVREDAPVFGQIARVAQMELSENTELQGMLSRTSEAISESAAARATIRDLLRTTTSTAGQSPAN